MDTERSLIAAVAQEPDNVDLRLICADYFEEIGDCRCEVIRLWHKAISTELTRVQRAEIRARIEEITLKRFRRWN